MQSFPITTNVVISILTLVRCTRYNKVYRWFAIGLWFSPGTLVSSNNNTDHNDITEILLKVALNTLTLTLYKMIWPRLLYYLLIISLTKIITETCHTHSILYLSLYFFNTIIKMFKLRFGSHRAVSRNANILKDQRKLSFLIKRD